MAQPTFIEANEPGRERTAAAAVHDHENSHAVGAERELNRIARTIAAIPNDARSCLEIGFNDLRVTRELQRRLDVVSVDLPRAVKSKDGFSLAFASIDKLPFADRSFDIVICTEVLEHLPEQVLVRGAAELSRVTKGYILVSVPYRQRVWNELFRCGECGHICNHMGHLRFFEEASLDALFAGTTTVHREYLGRVPGYAPDAMYVISYRLGGAWQNLLDPRLCPGCGTSPRSNRGNLLGWVMQRLIWRFERRAGPRPAWLLCLYKLAIRPTQ